MLARANLRLQSSTLIFFALCLWFCQVVDSAAFAASTATAPHLTVQLVSDKQSISAEQPSNLGLLFKLEKGWHIYWSNAGDSGEPPMVKWHLPAGLVAGPLQFPAPKRLPLGPLMDFGYEDEALLPAALSHVGRAVSGAAAITADVNWLVCRQSCIPGKATLSLNLSRVTGAAQDGSEMPLFVASFARMPKPLPAGAKAVFAPTATGFTMAVTGSDLGKGAEFFPLEQNQIANAAPQPITPLATGFKIALKKDDSLQTPLKQLSGVVVLGDGSAYQVEASPGAIPSAATAAGPSGSSGLLKAAGLAFLGGIILNLMPCVFPVLFIKALALVQSSAKERRHMRAQGLVYTLGILVSFWIVVALLLVLRREGQHLGWGFQFQSPSFVALMALLLFFLGLSLAGMFEIGLSVTSAGSSLAAQKGYAGSFFTGVLAMVVATPCTAPFMGAAIGFALSKSATVTFAIFTALGLGLALPYLILAFQPAWTRILPRPGAWMEVLKQATAVPIFATVIWMVWLFAQTAGVNALVGLLFAFLLLAIAGWILGRWPAKRVPSVFALLVIALGIAVPLYALRTLAPPKPGAAASSAAAADSPKHWEPFTPELVARYQAQGRPVFVDFTASWCLSCQVNERVVLERADVEERLHASNVALVRADWTQHDESIAQALQSLGRNGVPTYALYSGRVGEKPELLPEVLTPGLVMDALGRLRPGNLDTNKAALEDASKKE